MEGKSLLRIFQGQRREQHAALFWNQNGLWRAVRKGKWKLVSPDYTVQYNPWRAGRKGRIRREPPDDPDTLWELYDMTSDRTETNDLAKQLPDRVKELAALYKAWERRVTSNAR